MNESYLPQQATLDETCEWLRNKTGESWTLPRLLECGLMPWFWLDYTDGWPTIFGSRIEGYLAPVLFASDTQRLAADRQNVLVNMTRTHDGQIIKIGPPALSVPVAEIRFVRADIEQQVKDICAPFPQDERANHASVSIQGDAWVEKARAIALAYISKHKAQALFPNQRDVCKYLETELRNQEIFGAHDRPVSEAYILRNAIQGNWWKKNKP